MGNYSEGAAMCKETPLLPSNNESVWLRKNRHQISAISMEKAMDEAVEMNKLFDQELAKKKDATTR